MGQAQQEENASLRGAIKMTNTKPELPEGVVWRWHHPVDGDYGDWYARDAEREAAVRQDEAYDGCIYEYAYTADQMTAHGDKCEAYGRATAPAVVGDGVKAADIAAARRERDEAIEERGRAHIELAYLANELMFNGNSIGWIASKADNYKKALGDAWDALIALGGKCDGNTILADAIRQQLATRPAPAEVGDGALLDWLIGGIDRLVFRTQGGEWCAQDDVIGAWYGDTPRAALTAALAHKESK